MFKYCVGRLVNALWTVWYISPYLSRKGQLVSGAETNRERESVEQWMNAVLMLRATGTHCAVLPVSYLTSGKWWAISTSWMPNSVPWGIILTRQILEYHLFVLLAVAPTIFFILLLLFNSCSFTKIPRVLYSLCMAACVQLCGLLR